MAVALGSGAVLNVKPARLGGVQAAADLARVAADHGWATFVGGMLELGVGRAAAVAVAALPTFGLPTDLGPSARYVEREVTSPIVVDEAGRLVVPSGPGIGVEPDAGVLAEVAVDRIVLSR